MKKDFSRIMSGTSLQMAETFLSNLLNDANVQLGFADSEFGLEFQFSTNGWIIAEVVSDWYEDYVDITGFHFNGRYKDKTSVRMDKLLNQLWIKYDLYKSRTTK